MRHSPTSMAWVAAKLVSSWRVLLGFRFGSTFTLLPTIMSFKPPEEAVQQLDGYAAWYVRVILWYGLLH